MLTKPSVKPDGPPCTDFYGGSCPVGLECGCQYCTPFVFVDELAGTYAKKVDFWTSGHYSRSVLRMLQGESDHITAPHITYDVQDEHGGQRLGFVDFTLVVPLSAQFCLNSFELGRNSRAVASWEPQK